MVMYWVDHFSAWEPVRWDLGNALAEGVLAGSCFIAMAALGVLAWKRPSRTWRLAATPLALAFLSFGLMHTVQAAGYDRSPSPFKLLAALASLGTAGMFAWLTPWFLSLPTVDQVRFQSEAKVRALTGAFAEQEKVHAAEQQECETRLHGQNMESLGILAGGLAHDFNNLLGAMAGNLELARLETAPGSAMAGYLETLETLVGRSAGLVQQVLAYSGRGQAQSEPLDLNEQVERILGLMSASLVDKPAIHLALAPRLPPLLGDLAQVQQVIMNLLLNAAEAVGAENGAIVLQTGVEQLEASALAAQFPGQGLEPGLHVYLEVVDNGPGMPAGVLERIFDPFFTTKFTGRGLGLPAVQGILRSHHGGFQVRSQPGSGTAFKVLFPAGQEVPALASRPTFAFEASLGNYQGSGTVLVVDDEDPLRTIAVKALQRIGFHTLEARDGLEALQVFEAHQERIRLVLMDLTMPRMGGEEAYRVLRRSGVLVPVILSSGFTELDVLRHFHGRGIAGFLQKPYRLEALLTSIRNALESSGWAGDPRARDPLDWCKDMETGIPILDYQHRSLLESFNSLVVSVRQEQPRDQQEQAFLAFKKAALTHFGTEDRIMKRCAYPRAREHQATHASLVAQVDHLAGRIQAGELTFTPPVMDFLEGWLIHHMQEEDRQLGKFLSGQGH